MKWQLFPPKFIEFTACTEEERVDKKSSINFQTLWWLVHWRRVCEDDEMKYKIDGDNDI